MLRPVTGEVRVLQKAVGRSPGAPVHPCSKTVASVLVSKPSPVPPSTAIAGSLLNPAASLSSDKQTNANSGVRRRFSYSDFARQLALKPTATGAIAPSSKLLAQRTIHQANIEDSSMVVELGPGTGVFTEEILKFIRPDQKFFAIELNHTFVNATRSRCPDANVYHDAASALPVLLEEQNCQHADRIISSLPWTIFDKSEQNEMMNVIYDSLPSGGVFVSIVYLGAKFRSRGRHFIDNLQHHFSSVTHSPVVWKNLPPTQIYRCVK